VWLSGGDSQGEVTTSGNSQASAGGAPVRRRPDPSVYFHEKILLASWSLPLAVAQIFVCAGSVCWSGPEFLLEPSGFGADQQDEVETHNRFDFGDTDFEGGFNFIALDASAGQDALLAPLCGHTDIFVSSGRSSARD
jgi:hypothetical protein